MTTRYFFSSNGDYLGGFDGDHAVALVPIDAIEVPEPPDHGLDTLVNGQIVSYIAPVPLKDQMETLLNQMPLELQIGFGPYITLVYIELQKPNPDMDRIRNIINAVPDASIPDAYKPLKQQMLNVIPV